MKIAPERQEAEELQELEELEEVEQPPVAVGEIIQEKYRVERMIGDGGMGVVVAATHLALEQLVAIKVMRASSRTKENCERFLREARAAVRLKSHNVARVFDVATLDDGLPYLVMEYLEGVDLGVLVARDGALPIELALDWMLQACDAVAEAHAIGIIHRDIKPDNLFVTTRRDGASQVKVLDFGISKVAGTSRGGERKGAVTQDNSIMGSPSYMSPEQTRSSTNVDERTDVWSLGAVLYYLLTGHEAFDADTIPDIFLKVLTEAPPPIAKLRPDVPAGIAEIVTRCLEKDRSKRFESVEALACALTRFASRQRSLAPSWSGADLPLQTRPRVDPPAPSHDAERTLTELKGASLERTGRTPLIAAGLGLAMVAAAATVFIVRGFGSNGSTRTDMPDVDPSAPAAASMTAGSMREPPASPPLPGVTSPAEPVAPLEKPATAPGVAGTTAAVVPTPLPAVVPSPRRQKAPPQPTGVPSRERTNW